MKRIVAAITCVAFVATFAPLASAGQEEQPEPPPPPPPQTYPQPPPPPQQQPTYAYPPAPVYGQPTSPYGMPYGPDQVYRSGRRQRTVGMVLTFVGLGLGALGFALLYDAKYNTRNTLDNQVIEELFGIMFAITGVGSFIPGVILWANGSAKMDEAMSMGATGMSLAPTPRVAAAPGLTWTIRF